MRNIGLAIAAWLLLAGAAAGAPCEAVWRDAARGRDVPVRLDLPARPEGAAVILYSHGLGDSNAGGGMWKAAWTAAGFAVLSVQHVGSDDSLIKGAASQEEADKALRAAESAKELFARVADMKFALDRLQAHAPVGACATTGLDLAKVGVGGHSYGAYTTQLLAGERLGSLNLADPRLKAALVLSPSPPPFGTVEQAFGPVAVPVMMVTGTADQTSAQSLSAEERVKPYAGLTPGEKYLLVLDGGRHHELGGAEDLRSTAPHKAKLIIDASTAFWRAELLGDRQAADFLKAPAGFHAELGGADRFEAK